MFNCRGNNYLLLDYGERILSFMGDFKGQVGREKGRSRMTPAYLYGVLNYLFKLTFSVVQFLGRP